MKKTIFIGLFLGMLGGCYTQFSTLDEPRQPPISKVTYEIDSATGDTVKVVSQTDTIVKRDHETCYWTRNLWGEPELRCDNSYYSQDWYLYNDYPWWYHNSPYMYDAYGRCPQNYYYDESCRSCRYYTDRNNYYNGSGYSRGGSSSSGAITNGGVRRTRSSGVPSQSTIRSSAGSNLSKQESGGQNVNQGAQTGQSRRTRSSAVPSSATIQETPSNVNQAPAVEKRTVVEERASAPPPQPARESSPPPQDQSNTNVQSSPPPSPPPSNGGDQNDNNRNRRNPRSW